MSFMLGLALINLWVLERGDLQGSLKEASAKLRSALELSEKAAKAYEETTRKKYMEHERDQSDQIGIRNVRVPQSRVPVVTVTATLGAPSNSAPQPTINDDLRATSLAVRKEAGEMKHWQSESNLREVQREELQCSQGEREGISVDARGQRYKRFNSTKVSSANALWCYSSSCDRDHRWFKLEAALHHCTNLNDRCAGVQCAFHLEGERCFVKEGRKALQHLQDISEEPSQFYLKCSPISAGDQLSRSIAPARYDYLPSNDSCMNLKLEQVFNPLLTMIPFKEQEKDPDCRLIDTTYYDNFFQTAYRLCDGVTSKLFCATDNNPFHPVAADNANLCWGEHLHLSSQLAQKAHRLKHREWMSGTQEAYFNYRPGFLSGQCDRHVETPDIDGLFTGNFVRDLIESATWKNVLPNPVRVLEGPTVLTWRESNGKREDQNLWHSYMHYLNVYQALSVFGIEPGPRVRVIFLDNNIKVWHTELMSSIAGEVMTLGDLPQEKILLRGPVIIAPSMHNTPFQANHYEVAISKSSATQRTYIMHLSPQELTCRAFIAVGCTHPMRAPVGLAYTILAHYGLLGKPVDTHSVKVLFLARRGSVTRQVSNEEDLIAMLEKDSGVTVTALDFAGMSVREQIMTISSHDILITPHGAGATYVTFLPKYGGYLELWHDRQAHPNECPVWCLFNHLALWSGLRHVDNWNPPQSYGFGSRSFPVDLETLSLQYTELVDRVRRSKQLFIQAMCPSGRVSP
ncbi:hypothetical protein FOL47_008112 [Perkinsus chesapeaki]|uniref:Glycosyltransferase 61 catalytic domain-containing protein n=1 Tax=Perkinsus chesapeaki TaxID=330153 RepID=A0A7J6LG39_PERCH|nr:hypothetical protein FOL47_008112 [Perkinsus chesapeaki]